VVRRGKRCRTNPKRDVADDAADPRLAATRPASTSRTIRQAQNSDAQHRSKLQSAFKKIGRRVRNATSRLELRRSQAIERQRAELWSLPAIPSRTRCSWQTEYAQVSVSADCKTWRYVGLRNAGGIFGRRSFQSRRLCMAGPSHIVGGTARYTSPVQRRRFSKIISLIGLNDAALARMVRYAVAAAEADWP